MPQLWLAAVAAIAITLLGLPILRHAVHRPGVAMLIVGIPAAIDAIMLFPGLALGQLNIRVGELGALVVLPMGVAGLVRCGPGARRTIGLTVSALFAVALTRGIFRPEAPLEFSEHLLLVGGLLYGLSAPTDAPARAEVMRALRIISLVLLAGLLAVSAGLVPGERTAPLGAEAALVLAETLLLELMLHLRRPSARSVPSVAFIAALGLAVLVLQHRTVWIVTAVGLGVMVILLGTSAWRFLLIGAAAICLVVVFNAVGLDGGRTQFRDDNLVESLQQASTDGETFEWRVQRWSETLESNRRRGAVATWTGSGYGRHWVTFGAQRGRLEPPHNQYVEFAVRFGYVGAVAWLALMLASIMRLAHRRHALRDVALSNEAMLTLAVSLTVWCLAYSLNSVQPVLLGLILGVAWRTDRETLDESGSETGPVEERRVAGRS